MRARPRARREECLEMVGAARFELATTCTPCRYATRLRYAPTRGKVYQRATVSASFSTQQLDDVLQFLLHCGEIGAPHVVRAWRRGSRCRGARGCGAEALVEAIASAADGEALLVEELADAADQQHPVGLVVEAGGRVAS